MIKRDYKPIVERMIERGCELCYCNRKEFLERRYTPNPLVRSVCYKLLADDGLKPRQIGPMFGYDRSTVIAALKRCNEFLSINDMETIGIYNELKSIMAE